MFSGACQPVRAARKRGSGARTEPRRRLPACAEALGNGAGGDAEASVANGGRKTGARAGARRSSGYTHARGIGGQMLDLAFVSLAILFFLAAWAFVKGCERL